MDHDAGIIINASVSAVVAADRGKLVFVLRESVVGRAAKSSSSATAAAAAVTAGTAASSYWNHVEQGPPDAILGIAQAFRECVSPIV